MTFELHLTPHFEAFISAQLMNGRFRSRDDVIRAALALLEEKSAFEEMATARDRQLQLRTASMHPLTESLQGRDEPAPKSAPTTPATKALSVARRSPRGILADLHNHIDPDDIKEARRELWSGYLTGPSE